MSLVRTKSALSKTGHCLSRAESGLSLSLSLVQVSFRAVAGSSSPESVLDFRDVWEVHLDA